MSVDIFNGHIAHNLWSANQSPISASGSYDKNYVQSFNVASSVTVTHNLYKYPAITVVSSANQIVMGDIAYVDLNTAIVTFSAPFSGTVYCN